MLKTTLIALGRRVKADRTFTIDEEVGPRATLALSMRRAVMAVRGVILTLRTHKWVFPVFIGRGVVVTTPTDLTLSQGVTIGDYCRLDCLGRRGVTIGKGSTLRRGTHIEVTSTYKFIAEGCVIGERVGISEGCFIGAKGFVSIGADTDIGPGSKIIAEQHRFADPDRPIREQGVSREGIAINADCWLGANVTVLDGCTLGHGCVIAAGAVVRGDVPAGAIAAGVPAKTVGTRSSRASDKETPS